jgi:carbon storage regulator
MLVLSRKPLESIQIGENIVVTVLSVRGKKVRFGIDAPAQVPVHRTELIDAMAAPSSCPVRIAHFPDELLP